MCRIWPGIEPLVGLLRLRDSFAVGAWAPIVPEMEPIVPEMEYLRHNGQVRAWLGGEGPMHAADALDFCGRIGSCGERWDWAGLVSRATRPFDLRWFISATMGAPAGRTRRVSGPSSAAPRVLRARRR